MSRRTPHDGLTLLVTLHISAALVCPDSAHRFTIELRPMVWYAGRALPVRSLRTAIGTLVSDFGKLRFSGWAEGPGAAGAPCPAFESSGAHYAACVVDLARARGQLRTLSRIDRRLAALSRRLGRALSFDVTAMRFADALGIETFTFGPEALGAVGRLSDSEPRYLRLDRAASEDLLRRLLGALFAPGAEFSETGFGDRPARSAQHVAQPAHSDADDSPPEPSERASAPRARPSTQERRRTLLQ